ncbi:MAG: chromosomal replication initiator protein DnaA [Clostridia bacterium]|nr:chromosomal replication initiator protein DnaA [Clostridia bacterium]
MDVTEIWKHALPIIENNVSSISFDLYIQPLVAESFEDGTFTLCAPTTRDANYARNERHFPHIDAAVKAVAPLVEKVEIIDAVEKERRDARNNPAPVVTEAEPVIYNNNINPQQTFANFIVGKSNQEVAAMAEFVAKHPAKKINPLFIYGRSGLGKTHLLNAIANYILEDKPSTKLVLTSIEKFTDDYVSVIKQKGDFGAFREKYRNVDVLLIDDVQELASKQATQEEFFHTFNDLFEHQRQIVLTSDRHPNEIATLSERLQSRLKSGIFQDIRTPDIEMRTAILQKKAALEDKFLPNEVAAHIAEHSNKVNENIRDMEGHLIKIIVYAELNGHTVPTIEDCDAALADNSGDAETARVGDMAARVIATTANYFDVTPDEITGKRRTEKLANARSVAAYLLTKKLEAVPLTEIGEIVGGRTHAWVIFSRDKIAKQITTDDKLKTAVDDILNQLSK